MTYGCDILHIMCVSVCERVSELSTWPPFDIDPEFLLVKCRLSVHPSDTLLMALSVNMWVRALSLALALWSSSNDHGEPGREIYQVLHRNASTSARRTLLGVFDSECVCTDTAVRGCGRMAGRSTRRSLQWVPVWCTIMTCQNCRPLKTGIIHRGYLTKCILTGAEATPWDPWGA